MSVGMVSSRRLARLIGSALAASSLALAGFLATPSALASTSSTTKQITTNWETFFSAKTSVSKKISLLQNGNEFAKIIREQSGSPLSKGVSATVSKVTMTGKSSATVRYTLDEDGQPALKNQTGTAVRQNGVWKVGDSGFCALLHLEGTKVAACKTTTTS